MIVNSRGRQRTYREEKQVKQRMLNLSDPLRTEVIRISHCPKIALTRIPGRAKPQRKGAEGWRIIHKIKATLRSRNEVPHGNLLNHEPDLQAPCRNSDMVTNPVPPRQGQLSLFRLPSLLPQFILYLNLKVATQSRKPGVREDAVYSSSSCIIE